MLTDREFLDATREHTHTALSADLWERLNAVTPDTSDDVPVCMDGEGYDMTGEWSTLALGIGILIVFVAGAVVGGVLCSI